MSALQQLRSGMPRIVVDSRESRSGLAQLLIARGCDVASEELECGDYVLAEGFALERKEATDFVNSIMDRRIFNQIAVMKQTYRKVAFIIEGDVFSTRSAIAPEALNGALSYIGVIEDIRLFHTKDTSHTADLMITMARHAIDGLGYEIAYRGGKPKDRSPQAQFLVEGLPGIGPSAAKKLLQHFGTAHAIFTADQEALRKVPGVGPKTVASMTEVLRWDVRAGR